MTCASPSLIAATQTYDFEVVTDTTADCYGRYLIRVGEMHESLKIVRQCLDRLEPGPVMIGTRRWRGRPT